MVYLLFLLLLDIVVTNGDLLVDLSVKEGGKVGVIVVIGGVRGIVFEAALVLLLIIIFFSFLLLLLLLLLLLSLLLLPSSARSPPLRLRLLDGGAWVPQARGSRFTRRLSRDSPTRAALYPKAIARFVPTTGCCL